MVNPDRLAVRNDDMSCVLGGNKHKQLIANAHFGTGGSIMVNSTST